MSATLLVLVCGATYKITTVQTFVQETVSHFCEILFRFSVVIFMNLIGSQQVSKCLYCNRDPSLRLSKLFITITVFMLFSTQELFIM